MKDEEFYKKIEDQQFVLCSNLRQELIDRKLQRAYNLHLVSVKLMKEVKNAEHELEDQY